MKTIIKDIVNLYFLEKEILKIEEIQPLWSGFGSLSRIKLKDKSIIIKLIKKPSKMNHPRGWNNNYSNQRKVKSYTIETYWYEKYNQLHNCRTPNCLFTGTEKDYSYIVLEDLRNESFVSVTNPDQFQINNVISWLAELHRFFLNKETTGLWSIGSYWNLDTRPDEYNLLNEEQKKVARKVDQKLNQTKYKTIIHGDAKLSNFLFNDSQCAALDFQYIGTGVGVKDLAYFLSSIYNSDDLFRHTSRHIDYYFQCLNLPMVEQEWKSLYNYAWADFYRFLIGWCPTHKKVHKYSSDMFEKVSNEIK